MIARALMEIICADPPVDISCVWIGVGAKNVRDRNLLIVLNEVPDSLMRAKRSDKLAFIVFYDAEFDWVLLFLFLDLLATK